MPQTNFRPETNGFAFLNSWNFDGTEEKELRKILTGAIATALVVLNPVWGGTLAWLGVSKKLADLIANNQIHSAYGLCGGMAYAALDYYKAGRATPWRKDQQPTRDTPEGKRLRDYLWKRLIDSLSTGGVAPQTLAWMAMYRWVAKTWPFNGGPAWLLARSKEQWDILKKHINAGEPWPIVLVGTTENPGSNHQVLACGYDDPGDGTGTIYVYDMNCPGAERTLKINFRGQMLEAEESCRNDARGDLRGFFCSAYSPDKPPNID